MTPTAKVLPLVLGGAVAVALAIGACASSGVNQGDFNVVSLEQEWQLGQQLERDLAGQLKLVNDRRLNGYVNEVGRRIARQTELGRLPWEFHVVADDSINAFNVPGGHVYVHTGLIETADNVSELAGVLAHEIAHGVSRHGTEQLTKAYGFNILASLALGQNPKLYEQLLAQVVGAGTFAKFGRDAEEEADRLGVRYMYAAGYDPQGMVTMFEELLAQRRRRPGAVQRFFATHPLTEDRIAAVRREAAQLPDKRLVRNDNAYPGIRQRAARYGP